MRYVCAILVLAFFMFLVSIFVFKQEWQQLHAQYPSAPMATGIILIMGVLLSGALIKHK